MELPRVGEKMIAQPTPTTKPLNAPGWGGSRNGAPRNGAGERPLCPPVFVLISQTVAEFQIWNDCSGSNSSSSCRNASGPLWLCYGSQTSCLCSVITEQPCCMPGEQGANVGWVQQHFSWEELREELRVPRSPSITLLHSLQEESSQPFVLWGKIP